MTRLANISGKQAVKTFKKFGWNVVGQVGSHVVMTKPGMKANLSVPQHKWRAITPGIALRLAKFFGVSEDFWMNLQLRWDLYKAKRTELKDRNYNDISGFPLKEGTVRKR
jgi:predicted RNA binding protein YcfA (HicA-like mRNA interferase family)